VEAVGCACVSVLLRGESVAYIDASMPTTFRKSTLSRSQPRFACCWRAKVGWVGDVPSCFSGLKTYVARRFAWTAHVGGDLVFVVALDRGDLTARQDFLDDPHVGVAEHD
jgi:hypothetical protein